MRRVLLTLVALAMVGGMAGTARAHGPCGHQSGYRGGYHGHGQSYYRAPVHRSYYAPAPYVRYENVYPGGVAPYQVGYSSPGFSFWFGR